MTGTQRQQMAKKHHACASHQLPKRPALKHRYIQNMLCNAYAGLYNSTATPARTPCTNYCLQIRNIIYSDFSTLAQTVHPTRHCHQIATFQAYSITSNMLAQTGLRKDQLLPAGKAGWGRRINASTNERWTTNLDVLPYCHRPGEPFCHAPGRNRRVHKHSS